MDEQSGKVPAAAKSPDAGRIATRYEYPDGKFLGDSVWLDGNMKLHRKVAKDGTVTYQLFDLAKDEKEYHDLAGSRPKVVATMRKALAGWQRSVVSSLNGDDY